MNKYLHTKGDIYSFLFNLNYIQDMTYEETLEYLYNSVPMFQKIGAAAYKEGLHNTVVLDEHFGHPHKSYKTIHIAGTNGKGSCSHSIASVLQKAGYKVGLYTSPHLKDFRERIRVNGQCISEEYVIDFVKEERDFFEPLHPSFFELTTAMAFKYFAEQSVDIAVIEVGLGGRLDCTNIITPILSIITNISFDHTQFLGNTLSQIAKEKGGIIKKEGTVVIGETTNETLHVFKTLSEASHSRLLLAENDNEIINAELSLQGGITYSTRSFGTIHGELGGIYQEKNMRTIICAIKELIRLGLNISAENVSAGLNCVSETTGLSGRWQKIQDAPTVICDTGHNAGGWIYISRQLKMQRCKQMRIVFGMVDDKDIETVMEMLPTDALYYFTKAKTKRSVKEDEIANIGKNFGLKSMVFPDVKSAYKQAISDADKEDFIFIGGSSYVVSDFLSDCF